MKITVWMAQWAMLLALCACGEQPGEATNPLTPRAAGAVTVSSTLDPAALFDWAAVHYPQFFNGGSQQGQAIVAGYSPFTYRYWQGSGNYVGVSDGVVYVYGPMSGMTISRVGALEDFHCVVLYCGQPVLTSYQRFKESGLAPQPIPRMWDVARAYLDVDNDGVREVFTAEIVYNPATSTPQSAAPSMFRFYRYVDGSLVEDPQLLPHGGAGCIHPRKAVVADFNGDGRPDIFVACHGYDAAPFPGEHAKVVLSQPDGTYLIRDANDQVGFFHGAAAADFNGDGKPDVVVVNNFGLPSVRVWLNDGAGNFTPSDGYLPAALKVQANFFSVDVPDVDGDGNFDLVVGGHEWENAPTQVFLNPGSGNFSAVQPTVIPAVPNEGVVLDFVATGAVGSRVLWVLRTSGGDGTFYRSLTVQRVAWPTLASSVPLAQRGTQWQPWMIPAVVDGQRRLVSDVLGVTSIYLAY